jgi:hypothetical protein
MSDINFNIILPSTQNYLASWGAVRLEKLTVFRLAKKPQTVYMELKRFIFTTARYLSLGCDKFNPVQSVPNVFFKYHLIPSFHPGLGLQTCLFPSRCTTIFIMRATFPSHLIVLTHHSNNHA